MVVVVGEEFSEFSPSRSSQYLPYNYLDGEPGVTDTLNVEEGLVGVGAVLVQGPRGNIGTGVHRDVADHGDAHVRVRLEAEREDGYADVEY